MPSSPGQHGAKLTLFIPKPTEVDDYDPSNAFPLFVKRRKRDYVYLGPYQQPRCSDRLGYAEMELEVPSHVKEHHAKVVGKKDKPKWVVDAMKWERVVDTDEIAEAVVPKDIMRAFQRASSLPIM